MLKKESSFRIIFGMIFLASFTFLLQLWIRKWKKDQQIFTYKLIPVISPPDKPKSYSVEKKATKVIREDDLTDIGGIGPKTAKRLHDLGISSFKQISDIKPVDFIKILKEAKIPTSNADNWIAQSKQLMMRT